MRVFSGLIVFAGLLFSSTIASGQAPAGQGPPPLKNLQVLSKDLPRQQVIQTMQAFAQGLGVRCEYCHVDEPGRQDFSADDKRTKVVARAMLRMTDKINSEIPAAVSKSATEATRVQCATCHRGVPIPRQLTEILTQTMTDKGLSAALDQYREMRKQFYGGQSYDFSEVALMQMGNRLNQAGKPDDAITVLQMNLEFYPRSTRTLSVLAQVYGAKKDIANQIATLEKVAALEPQNEQVKSQLDRLKKQ